MAQTLINGHLLRKDFSRIGKVLEIPDLIEVQKKSFREFLQLEAQQESDEAGLQSIFKGVFPITDFSGNSSLEFVGYELMTPKYTEAECLQKGLTYASPMRIQVMLTVWDKDEETGTKSVRDIKEQEVYFGEIPLMTGNGSFIINGTERVIVSQLHRSPGVFFEHEKGKAYTGKLQFTARVIPYHGSWLDFECDQKDWIYVRIDKRRKMLATILLKALGYSVEELLNYFYPSEKIVIDGRSIEKSIELEYIVGQRASLDIKHPESGDVIVKKDRKITRLLARKLVEAGVKFIQVEAEDIIGRVASQDIVDPSTGEVVLECNQVLTREVLDEISERKINNFNLVFTEAMGTSFRETLLNDRLTDDDTKSVMDYRAANPDDPTSNLTLNAKIEIYKRLKPGEPPTVEMATKFFNNLFFTADRYDLSKVGRLKLNRKLSLDVELENTTLTKEDIMGVVR
ncbi:DNA-directed RNA polymerase beta subunit, partial [hydrothermal vent metagenome]